VLFFWDEFGANPGTNGLKKALMIISSTNPLFLQKKSANPLVETPTEHFSGSQTQEST
jgi:hypothetical protein